MTSSDRHLSFGQARWDYNNQHYKSTNDVFLEGGLFSIIVLAHGRPEITRQSVLSTIECLEFCHEQVEWIFIENALNKENAEFFDSLPLHRKVVVRQRNYGINEGINQGWALSRGEFAMIHENDWLNIGHKIDFLAMAKDIFDSKESVGIVQLRDPFDPNENFGFGKPEYNPWSCNQETLERHKIKVWKETTRHGHKFFVSEYPNGFNNNPIIMRKSIYRECGPYPEAEVGCDPKHGETLYQGRVAATGCAIAHINIPLYRHLGRVPTKVI
jgi:hypothetical protein